VNAEAAGGNNVVVQPDVRIEDDPAPDAFIAVEKYPVAVTQVRPVYPDLARRAGVEGVVWVKALVDRNGHVKKAIVEKSDSEIFNQPATDAAMQWVFTPAMMNNGPVSVWVSIPFRFRIGGPAG
jgi:protein TonB